VVQASAPTEGRVVRSDAVNEGHCLISTVHHIAAPEVLVEELPGADPARDGPADPEERQVALGKVELVGRAELGAGVGLGPVDEAWILHILDGARRTLRGEGQSPGSLPLGTTFSAS
jgi:hypothetical protein